ncbi:hypothetical protein [Parasphingorhabdus sp.]
MVEHSRNPGNGAPLRMFMLLIACWLLGRLLWEGAMLPGSSAGDVEHVAVRAARSQSELRDAEHQRNVHPLKRTNFRVDTLQAAVPANRVSVKRFESSCCRAQDQVGSNIALQPASARMGGGVNHDNHAQAEQSVPSTTPLSLEPPSQMILSKNSLSEDKALTGYAWLVARQGSGQYPSLRDLAGFQLPGQSPGQPYGGSQAGGQLALRIAGQSGRNLSLTARISTALASSGEEEIALGVKVKPLRRIPVTIHAEQRFNLDRARSRGAAIFAAGGTGPDPLPGKLTLETYGQGGYLFGDRASYFFDAAATVQRDVVKSDIGQVTAGPGLWAGGQKGVSRIDVGPSMKVILPLGETQARVGLDWRQRVSGTALPGSGLTVSVSAGF